MEKKKYLLICVICYSIVAIGVMTLPFFPQELLSEWKIEVISLFNILFSIGGITGIYYCW